MSATHNMFVYKATDIDERERDWSDLTKVLVESWMRQPWYNEAFPNACNRKKFIMDSCREFYYNKIAKDCGDFVTYNIRTDCGKRIVIGGQCVEFEVTMDFPKDSEGNLPHERAFAKSYKEVLGPLKTFADSLRTELWFFRTEAVHHKWINDDGRRKVIVNGANVLYYGRLKTYYKLGKILSNLPIAYFVTTGSDLMKYYQELEYSQIASIPCEVDGINDNTNHVFLAPSNEINKKNVYHVGIYEQLCVKFNYFTK